MLSLKIKQPQGISVPGLFFLFEVRDVWGFWPVLPVPLRRFGSAEVQDEPVCDSETVT